MSRLDAAAASRYWISACEFDPWRGFSDAIRENESHGFFYAEFARHDSAILQNRGDQLIGALILLPGSNVVAKFDLFECSSLLKRGRDPRDLAYRRKHHREHSLAESPLGVREVLHAGSAGEKDRVDRGFVHVAPRCFLSLQIFLAGDGLGLTRHRSDG